MFLERALDLMLLELVPADGAYLRPTVVAGEDFGDEPIEHFGLGRIVIEADELMTRLDPCLLRAHIDGVVEDIVEAAQQQADADEARTAGFLEDLQRST